MTFSIVFNVFSLGRVVLYIVFMVSTLSETLVKTLVKNLAKILVKNLTQNQGMPTMYYKTHRRATAIQEKLHLGF